VRVWAAGFPGNLKPMRRAARLDGYVPVNLQHPDQVAEAAATLSGLRDGEMGSFDIAVGLARDVDVALYARAGATWWLPEIDPGTPIDTVRGLVRDGPFREEVIS
jgi:hypothetical protein